MAGNVKVVLKSVWDDKGVKEAQKSLNGISKGIGTSFKALGVAAAAATAAVTGVAISSIKAFASFDSKMNQSIAIMGNVSDALRTEMSDAAREVAKTTTFSADQAAESYFFLASAGLDAAASIKAMPQVARFAQAGMFDMALATDLLTDAQSALGLTVRDDAIKNLSNMARVSDVLVKANTLANASVEQFSTALTTKAGPAMRAVGMDVEEGVAVLAAFADQGIKSELAGTNFAIVLRDLQTKAISNKDAFAEAGVAVFDASGEMRNMADIVADLEKATSGMSDEQKKAAFAMLGFSDKSMGALAALLGTSDAIRGYETALRNAGGTTNEVAEKQLNTFSAQLQLLQSNFDDIKLALGESFMPAMQELVALTGDDLIPVFENLARDVGPMIVDIIELIVGVIKEATTEGTDLNTSLEGLGESFKLLFGVVSNGTNDAEGFSDTLANLVDIISWLVTTIASLTAGFEGFAYAWDKFWNNNDIGELWKFLTTDTIDYANSINSATNKTDDLTIATTSAAGELNRFNNLKLGGVKGEVQGVIDELGRVNTTTLAGILAASGKPVPTTTTTTSSSTGGSSSRSSGPSQADQVASAIKDTQKAIATATKRYNDTVTRAKDVYKNSVQKATDAYKKATETADSERAKALLKANSENAAAIVSINQNAAAKLADIVAQSMGRLRDAFRSAVETNVATLFSSDEVGKSVDSLVSSLQERLAASKALIENSAKLSSAGFSQTFIEQVVGAGLQAGNELANAVLEATPETQSELQSLFGSLESTSETGMDALSQTIYDGAGLATSALKQMYADTLTEQTQALADQAAAYATAQADIQAQFDKAMTDAATTRDDALAEAMKTYQDSLVEAARDFKDSLDEIEADFNEKIKALGKLKGSLLKDIAGVQGLIDNKQALAGVAAQAGTVIANTPTVTVKTPNVKNQTPATVINVNVKTDATQSTAQVGQVIAKTLNTYSKAAGGGLYQKVV